MTNRLWFPVKKKLDLADDALVAVFTAYNESARLPFFLDYYRRHGVSHFLAIDNNSTDGSAEFLQRQEDVAYFFTSGSYAASEAGRQWTTELARHYALGRWCLTVDLDELLVFPGSETMTIRNLTEYFDAHGYQSFFTILLDMYGPGRMSEAVYSPGRSYLDVCNRYEVDTYTFHPPGEFPPLQIFGGPRQRLFRELNPGAMGPSMRKLPLMKWTKETEYLFSTHSSRPCRLADITGATLHFKLFSSFKELAASEVVRGDRAWMDDYRQYAQALDSSDPCFENAATRNWCGTLGLVRDGVMMSSGKWARFVGTSRDPELADQLRAAQATAESATVLKLQQLPVLWPILNRFVFRFCDVRSDLIIAVLREPAIYAPPRMRAMNDAGETLGESEPFVGEGLIGVRPADQRSLIQIRMRELSGPGPLNVHLVLQHSNEVLARLRIERQTLAEASGEHSEDNALAIIASCVPGEGTTLRCRIAGGRLELNKTQLSIYVDGRWRGLVSSPRTDGWTKLGRGREQRLVEVELADSLREGSVVEVYLARRNIQLRKSPLMFKEGRLQPIAGWDDADQTSGDPGSRTGLPPQ